MSGFMAYTALGRCASSEAVYAINPSSVFNSNIVTWVLILKRLLVCFEVIIFSLCYVRLRIGENSTSENVWKVHVIMLILKTLVIVVQYQPRVREHPLASNEYSRVKRVVLTRYSRVDVPLLEAGTNVESLTSAK